MSGENSDTANSAKLSPIGSAQVADGLSEATAVDVNEEPESEAVSVHQETEQNVEEGVLGQEQQQEPEQELQPENKQAQEQEQAQEQVSEQPQVQVKEESKERGDSIGPESEDSEKYYNTSDVSDDEEDLKYFYEKVFSKIDEKRKLNILATRRRISKPDKDIEQLDPPTATNLAEESDSDDVEPLPDFLEPLTNHEKQGLLMKYISSKQFPRYEAYKRSTLSKSFLKKISTSILGQNLPLPVHHAISGVAKYFIMDLLEKSKDVYEMNEKVDLSERLIAKRKRKFEEYKSKREAEKRQKLAKDSSNGVSKIQLTNFANRNMKSSDMNIKHEYQNEEEMPPLLPYHVREAFRMYKEENRYPQNTYRQQGEGNGMMFR